MANYVKVRVDHEASMMYIRLTPAEIRYTEDFGDDRLVDYDDRDRVVGVEFIGIAGGVDIDGLPEPDRIREALVAEGLGNLIAEPVA